MPVRTAACGWCGAAFRIRRSDARFCGVRCRVAAHRARRELADLERSAARGFALELAPLRRRRDELRRRLGAGDVLELELQADELEVTTATEPELNGNDPAVTASSGDAGPAWVRTSTAPCSGPCGPSWPCHACWSAHGQGAYRRAAAGPSTLQGER